MRYFSMFSGIGGFEHGIEQAYEDHKADGSATDPSEQLQGVQCGGNITDNPKLRGWPYGEERVPICVGYSEIDKYADAVYKYHYGGTNEAGVAILQPGQEGQQDLPQERNDKLCEAANSKPSGIRTNNGGHRNYGDATKIIAEDLPDFDLLVGGFPCQAFSIAGKRLGFDDTRGTLFFDIARILKVKRPRNFILENVKGLLSHDAGRTFKTIIATLVELGYGVEWQVLNSKNFGVPQNRERVFIIGYLGGEGCGKVFPIGENNTKVVELQGQPVSNTLKARYEATGDGSYIIEGKLDAQEGIIKCGNIYESGGEAGQVVSDQGQSPTIHSGKRGGIANMPIVRVGGLYDKPDEQHQAGSIYSDVGICPSVNTAQGGNRMPIVSIESSILRGRPKMPYEHGKRELNYTEYKDICPTLTENCAAGDQKNIVLPQIRRLTPIECERLQGFPDNWTKYGKFEANGLGEVKEISDSQRYKMCGNSLTTSVVVEIVKRLYEA